MTLQDLLAELRKHNRSVQTLAAFGAELQLRQDGVAGDPEVRELLRGVVEALDPTLLAGLTKEQQSAALSYIRTYFRNAVELLEQPERAPGWNHTDPEMLEGQGQTSSAVVPRIEAIAAEKPDLAAVTRRSGTLLDVGTGVGHLAIAAARTWPALRVVGIDVWEPALALARANVAVSGVAERIQLRAQNVADLAETDAFSLVWLAAPFIPREVVETALGRLYQALEPGGWLVVGYFTISDEPVSGALIRLQVVRSGGYPWRSAEIIALMRLRGYEQVECTPGPVGAEFVLGRRPLAGAQPRHVV